MKFASLLLALLGCLLLPGTPQGRAAEALPLDLQADAVNLSLEQDTTEAVGSAQLTYGGVVLRADQIIADRKTGGLLDSRQFLTV